MADEMERAVTEAGKPQTMKSETAEPEAAKPETAGKPERTDLEELETAVEAILFASGEPVKMDRICLALGLEPALAERVLHRLKDYYAFERRGIRLLQMEDAWQLCSSPDYAEAVRRAFEIRKPAKLSQPALEVLTIFAYYQPTTRAYVDKLRGVDSSYTVSLLLERKLIEPCGRLQAPGRPQVYRTTKQFLRAFHLTSLDDLPPLPEGGERLRPEEQAAILAAEGADAALLTTKPPEDAERKEETLDSGPDTPEGAAASEEEEYPEGAIGMEGTDDDSAVDTGHSGVPAVPAVPDAGADSSVHAGEETVPVPADWTGAGAAVSAAGEETGGEKAGKEEKKEIGGEG